MTEIEQMREYLKEAKTLLDYVYYYAGDNGNTPLEDNMSRADSCINDSLDAFDQIEEQLIDDASWRA